MLKLFVEEEDLHVHLLFDCSRSMDWGEPRKFDYVRKIVAGLAYLTLANLDRAAAVPLGLMPGAYPAWAPSRGRHRFLQLLRYLADCPLAGSGAPPSAVTLPPRVALTPVTLVAVGLVTVGSDAVVKFTGAV